MIGVYDIVIVGGTAGGLSVAVSSLRSGLDRIRIVESGQAVVFPELVGERELDIGYGEPVVSVEALGASGAAGAAGAGYGGGAAGAAGAGYGGGAAGAGGAGYGGGAGPGDGHGPEEDGSRDGGTEDPAPEDPAPEDLVVVNTSKSSYRTRVCLIADRRTAEDWRPPIPVEVTDRVHVDEVPVGPEDDVMIVGYTDHAVEYTATACAAGARVVLAAGGMDPTLLSPAGDHMLRRLERERRATLLYRAVPEHIGDVGGYPMAYFGDRRTPDLQFDHVVFASLRRTLTPAEVGCTPEALATGRVWFLGEPEAPGSSSAPSPGSSAGGARRADPAVRDKDSSAPSPGASAGGESSSGPAGSGPTAADPGLGPVPTAPGHRIGVAIAEHCFPELDLAPPAPSIVRRDRHQGAIAELRAEHYNAVITHFEPAHSDLWVLRVRPDRGDTAYLAGQYASLGLGFWERRSDEAEDRDLDARWDKLIRRSYSISSRILDQHGYLADAHRSDELEFYIVLVRPDGHNVPALTPRLALKRPGDRIYLGPKVAGRYTLASVTDPAATVVFLGTGTGEAPHNSMVVELLRKGHMGPVVSAVSVRQWADLGYLEQHRALEARYPNYHYLPLPTREPDVAKRYLQDVLRGGELSSELGVALDPSTAHVFCCGNPAMIGLPTETTDGLVYPEPEGVVAVLERMGFVLDRRGRPGNIHYEEYW